MSRKSKGINAERDLIHRFWKENWCAVRVAGSGSMRYPACDILASNKLRKLAIECKCVRGEGKYITSEEAGQLRLFAESFGAEAWIAVKFDRMPWHFVSLEDGRDTGNSILFSREIALQKGLLFEEVIR